MKRRRGWSIFVFGLAGSLLGLLLEWAGPRLHPALVVRDGMMWGAFAGLCVGYLPNLRHMGREITKRESGTLNLAVGILAFLGISAAVILLMLFVLWVASLFTR
jgi:hypothetical protein